MRVVRLDRAVAHLGDAAQHGAAVDGRLFAYGVQLDGE